MILFQYADDDDDVVRNTSPVGERECVLRGEGVGCRRLSIERVAERGGCDRPCELAGRRRLSLVIDDADDVGLAEVIPQAV